VDIDEHKVRSVLDGRAPFFEPGLEELLRTNVAAGRLTATSDTAEGVRRADIALVCVGTPSERNGNQDFAQLRRVVADIVRGLAGRTERFVLVIRSTVFPGTCEELVATQVAGLPVAVVSNPEFLREGAAVSDFMEPSLIVVGGDDRAAVDAVAGLYDRLDSQACRVTLRTAEMIKYACNAFHAVKIDFANEIGALCQRTGVDALEVMGTLCRDTKLNVSPAYLKPGFAFGGSCLPKDLRALTYRAARMDVRVPLLEAALESNEQHLNRGVRAVLDLGPKRIGVFGLTFKENTDDLRESPVVTMLEYLIGKGRDIRVYDPHLELDAIYGSNRQFLLNAIPHIGRLMEGDLGKLLAWAEAVVVTQQPPAAMRERIVASGAAVVDLAMALGSPKQG
jgi:GDP-mannose 6-dehydrogenase